MQKSSQNSTQVFYNTTENEIYLIEYVAKSGDDDTIFLEHDEYSYLMMNRKVFDQLDNIVEIGDL
jgi:hypothetical protein